MALFDEFLNGLKANIAAYAKEKWQEHAESVKDDAEVFIEKAKADLERWLMLLEGGGLTKDDVTWLIQGKKDLAEMNALKQIGLAKVKIDRCRIGILNIVKKTLLEFLA